MMSRRLNGFTLAELLISLAILGEIATFTIPKVLSAQQQGTYNAASKEAAGIISQAYYIYSLNNTVSSSTRFGDVTGAINYVQFDTTRTIDNKQGSGSLSCTTASGGCLVLHNGGVIRYSGVTMGGTGTTNAIEFHFDPNGTYSGTTNSADKSVNFFLYYSGRLTTRGTTEPNTVVNGNTYATPDPSLDPPWFSW